MYLRVNFCPEPLALFPVALLPFDVKSNDLGDDIFYSTTFKHFKVGQWGKYAHCDKDFHRVRKRACGNETETNDGE